MIPDYIAWYHMARYERKYPNSIIRVVTPHGEPVCGYVPHNHDGMVVELTIKDTE